MKKIEKLIRLGLTVAVERRQCPSIQPCWPIGAGLMYGFHLEI